MQAPTIPSNTLVAVSASPFLHAHWHLMPLQIRLKQVNSGDTGLNTNKATRTTQHSKDFPPLAAVNPKVRIVSATSASLTNKSQLIYLSRLYAATTPPAVSQPSPIPGACHAINFWWTQSQRTLRRWKEEQARKASHMYMVQHGFISDCISLLTWKLLAENISPLYTTPNDMPPLTSSINVLIGMSYIFTRIRSECIFFSEKAFARSDYRDEHVQERKCTQSRQALGNFQA